MIIFLLIIFPLFTVSYLQTTKLVDILKSNSLPYHNRFLIFAILIILLQMRLFIIPRFRLGFRLSQILTCFWKGIFELRWWWHLVKLVVLSPKLRSAILTVTPMLSFRLSVFVVILVVLGLEVVLGLWLFLIVWLPGLCLDIDFGVGVKVIKLHFVKHSGWRLECLEDGQHFLTGDRVDFLAVSSMESWHVFVVRIFNMTKHIVWNVLDMDPL